MPMPRPSLVPALITACVLLSSCGDESPPRVAIPVQLSAEPARQWLGPVELVDVPAADGARFPHLGGGTAGSPAVMSWLEPGAEGEFVLRHARWRDGAWGAPGTISAGRDWFINWADFPSVVPVTANLWIAHWLQQKPGNVYSYDVRMSTTSDAGATWSAPVTPHDDGTPTEHGFVSIVATAAGEPYGIWLDGRNTAGESHGHGSAADHGAGGSMTLRGARVHAGGATHGAEIDSRVCDCCQTDAVRTTDATVVVYRDRSGDELRDIYAARLDSNGWSGPVAVHEDGWRIAACPVNGPAIDAHGGNVAVAWFTAPDQPRVRLAFSSDAGRTFAAPLEVASGKVVGRVDVVLLADGRAVVSWLEEVPGGAEVRAQPFTAAGPAGSFATIARAAIARSSGFPQMLLAGDQLLFAWTETGTVPRLRTATAALQ
jgi:hypothetical protein